MREKLVNRKSSMLAKELGFTWTCRYSYDYDGSHYTIGDNIYWSNAQHKVIEQGLSNKFFNNGKQHDLSKDCSAPTQRMLQKWLWVKHKITIEVWTEHYKDGTNFLCQALLIDYNSSETDFIKDGSAQYGDNHEYPTYEEALEKGLELGLKLIKS